MAIDTKEKRMGVIGVGRPFMRSKFSVATPDEQWRITVGNAYGGNALTPPAAGGLFRLVGNGGLAGQGSQLVGPGGLA